MVLITDNQLPFLKFRRDLEKFCYSSTVLEGEKEAKASGQPKFTHEISKEVKEKEVKGFQNTKMGKEQRERH